MPKTNHQEYGQKRREEQRSGDTAKPVVFVAVDGEGIEEEEGQRYALLSSSFHNPIINRQGLPTEQCLRYLLGLKQGTQTRVVAYGATYDINMLLRDLSPKQLTSLYETEECWYHGKENDYRINRVKGKTFTVSEYSQRRVYHDLTEKLRSVTVWDVFGFFQGSFLKAVKEWKIPLTPEQQDILAQGKAGRGGFLWKDLADLIEYNHLECDLLVLLMDKVQEMLRKQGLYLARWDGAGSIAATLMKKHNVKTYVKQGFHPEVEESIMRAYFGGRSQCVQFGHFEGPVYCYDINSSYPSSYLDLPSLHGKWSRANGHLPDQRYVLYELEWCLPHDSPITPFPFRWEEGGIGYPTQGRGVYHSLLVDVAMKRWSKCIHFDHAWVFTPDTEEKPFEFVLPFMEERLKRKRDGDLSHITMKLGANSIYGKTAQSISYKDTLPPYQSYYWAGLITSWTHAQLLGAAIQKPKDIIFFGTDSIFSSSPLNLPFGTTLKTWEDCGTIDKFELYQPGLYRMHINGEEPQCKTRGLHPEEIDFDELASIWGKKKYGGVYNAEVTRFQGLEVSMAQNRIKDWRTWKQTTKQIHLRPAGYGDVNDPGRRAYHDLPSRDLQNFRYSYIYGGDMLSSRFEKRKMKLPDPDNQILMNDFLAACEELDNPET
jgi:hypothetical protein